jgi:serine/threonine protein kinase
MENLSSRLLEDAPVISGFEVLAKLGSGGMGDVFLARQLSLDRTVAIKVLHERTEGARSRCRHQESWLMAALTHPHVVAVHDCGQVDGRDYLIMEHVKGASLREHMKAGVPWPAAKALPILDATADALAYIHGREILHLDLKPENVLLDEEDRAKITDFGLAVLNSRAQAPAGEGAPYGTLDYCAPEQRYDPTVPSPSKRQSSVA